MPAEKKYTKIVNNMEIEITRKKIKNLYLRVKAPTGKIKVSAPLHLSEKKIWQFIEKNQAWILAQRKKQASKEQNLAKEYKDGEIHYLWGQPFTLRVIEKGGRYLLEISEKEIIYTLPPGSELAKREKHYLGWCKKILLDQALVFSDFWQERMQLKSREIRIKKMRSKWGSCNIKEKRIWLSLNLIHYPQECLEFILVHELAHLLERGHNKRFYAIMDHFLPSWRERAKILMSP